jgi:L-threonylcarbamoyladenylate synthase
MKEHLEAGGLVVYPTSTLPGLGCLPSTLGLDNLFMTKSRPENMPVSLGVATLEQANELVEIPNFLPDMLDSFTKGGITVILPAINKLDSRLGGNQIAIRVFSHPAATKLAEDFGPITATSANESGEEAECDTEIAAKILGVADFIPGICPNGRGSTFIRLERDELEIRGWRLTVMREGVVPPSDVMRWWTIPA